MLHGRFGESSGRPYVWARVFIPRLGLVGNVSFIFDTGALLIRLRECAAGRRILPFRVIRIMEKTARSCRMRDGGGPGRKRRPAKGKLSERCRLDRSCGRPRRAGRGYLFAEGLRERGQLRAICSLPERGRKGALQSTGKGKKTGAVERAGAGDAHGGGGRNRC